MVSAGWGDISSRCYRPVPHSVYVPVKGHIYIIDSACSECMSCCADVYRVCHVAVCSCTTCSQLLLAGKLIGVLLLLLKRSLRT